MKVTWDFSELIDFANKMKDTSSLEMHLENATREIAKALRTRIKGYTPALDYDLIHAWDDNKFLVTETTNGYEVILVNKMDYAIYVNDGHRQRPGRFIPGYWANRRRFVYDPHSTTGMVLSKSWVQGRFFVEKGIASMTSTSEIEQIIMQELQKWWDSI